MPTLQTITDDLLIRAIDAARTRLVFIAPAVWPPVAEAVARTWARLGGDRVTAILDVNAEVCRLGFGSLEGLQILQKAAAAQNQTLGNEPGVRICVVIADQQTFIFSPTPKLIEAQPGEKTEAATTAPRTNGIILDQPPATLSLEVGAGPDKELTRTIGLDPVHPTTLEAVADDLKQHPPKSFDLSRAVQVYNAQIQFVELKVTGCHLSGQSAQLPKDIIPIVKKNKALAAKITNSIKLLDTGDELVSGDGMNETTIKTMRAQIDQDLLVHVPGGTVYERSRRQELDARVQALNAAIASFSAKVETTLADRFVSTAEELAKELLPEVMQDIPKSWHRYLGSNPRPEDVRHRIKDALLRSFGDPAGRVSRMNASVTFKDVTYEMLCDSDFTQIIAENFEGLPTMEKYQAAKERPSAKDAEPDLFQS